MAMMGQTGGIDAMRDPYLAKQSEPMQDRPLARGEKVIAEAIAMLEMRVADLSERLRPVMGGTIPGIADDVNTGQVDVDPRSDHVRALDGLASQIRELESRLGRILDRLEV